MCTRRLIVIALLYVYVNAEYRFGPRLPDLPSFTQKRSDTYADMLTKNNQQPSAPLIPVAAPTIYRPPDPNTPIYLSGPNAQQGPPPYQTTTYRPTQQLSSDLSRIPRPAQSNPYSERDKLFGIKPLVDPRAPQPFNVIPNLFGQPSVGPSSFPQQNRPFEQSSGPRVIETVTKDLHVYPAKVDHAVVGAIGAPIQQSPNVDVPLVPYKNEREIDRYDTGVNRFASESEIQQRNRFVLPMNLANAPLESFLRKVEPPKQGPVVSVGTQPANANTRILTSDVRIEARPTTMRTPLGQGHTLPPDRATPFTTYPDYRADLFPELINHAHDDKRPASGRRVGPQGRFGGGTNEFREDLGKSLKSLINKKFICVLTNINNQLRPWQSLPHRSDESTNRPPNADYRNVALETLHNSNNNQPASNSRLDQDLSKTQPFSIIPYSKFDKDFPEVITPAPKSRETTTLVGVPLYPEFGNGYHGRSGSGPANQFIGGGISPAESGTQVKIDQVSTEMDDGLRPYRGPEEITRSRYQGLKPETNRNRHFKLDLLNE